MPTPSMSPITLVPALSSVVVDDPVPPEIRAVIELFTSQLAKVPFPDVDAASLRREADELRAEAASVARAREALAAALTACDVRMATLVQSSARAVAYARIYSEAHADRRPLADALAALPVHAAAPLYEPVPTPKRRGRPPGRSTTPRNGAELFAAPSIGGEVRAIDASAPAAP